MVATMAALAPTRCTMVYDDGVRFSDGAGDAVEPRSYSG